MARDIAKPDLNFISENLVEMHYAVTRNVAIAFLLCKTDKCQRYLFLLGRLSKSIFLKSKKDLERNFLCKSTIY